MVTHHSYSNGHPSYSYSPYSYSYSHSYKDYISPSSYSYSYSYGYPSYGYPSSAYGSFPPMPENPMAIIEGLQRDLMNIQREVGALARFLIPPGGPGPFGAGGIPPFFNPGPMPGMETSKATYAKGLIMPESVMDEVAEGSGEKSVMDEVAEGSGEKSVVDEV